MKTKSIYFLLMCFIPHISANATPGAFDLISPSNNSTSIPTRPSYSWKASSGAVKYKIQVLNYSTSPNWGSGWVYEKSDITSKYHDVEYSEVPLIPEKKYIWRVVAYGSDNSTKSSNQQNSFTISSIPATPSWVSPINGFDNSPPQRVPVFDWMIEGVHIRWKIFGIGLQKYSTRIAWQLIMQIKPMANYLLILQSKLEMLSKLVQRTNLITILPL